MCAAEPLSLHLDTVSYDPALAVLADRRHLLDCTLEAVEHMPHTRSFYDESLVIVIPARLTLCHGNLLGILSHSYGMRFGRAT